MAKIFGINKPNLIDPKVVEYNKLREEAKLIKSRMDTLASEIKDYASANGTKDDKGSYYCENENFFFGKVAKKSVIIREEDAIEFFKSRGLMRAIETVERIVEMEVENYLSDGTITIEDVESFTTTKVSYAIDVKKKEEMPVVEQSEVGMAASKKPAKLFRKAVSK